MKNAGTTSRTLKVYQSCGGNSPKINLQGKWLLDVGFSIGDYINIDVKANQLIITKIETPDELSKGNLKTTLSKEMITIIKDEATYYHTNESEVVEKALLQYFKKRGNKRT